MIPLVLPLLLAGAALTPAEGRGRELYLHGAGATTATVGDTAITAPLPCAGCHGADGRGRIEGGVRAPEITWDALTHPARARVAYDAGRLVRAVTLGFDSSGHALASPMPRYQLTRADAEDLIAYLRRLGTLPEPGVSESALIVGVLLPNTPAREVVRAAAMAWADRVNANGGVYARRIELRFADQPSAEDQPFAFIGWGDDGTARWMEEHEVPFLRAGGDELPALATPPAPGTAVGVGAPAAAAESRPVPSDWRGPGEAGAGRFVFDMGPSPEDEVRRLVGAAVRLGALPIAVSGAEAHSPLAAAARAACRAPGCRFTTRVASARAVLCLDAASLKAVPSGAVALVRSALASEAVNTPLGETILAARALPSDIDPAAAAAYSLPPGRAADQWSLLASARVAEEILRRAGAGVTRESFIAALRSARGLATGFSPPVTFGEDRTHGTITVRLLRIDRASGTLAPLE